MRILIVAAPAMLLAACNNSPTVTADNASVGEVANKVRESGVAKVQMRPGEWVTEAKLDSLDMPGMPPSAAEHMKQMMATKVSGHKYCLTPEMAAKPNEDFFSGDKSGCRYDHFEMDGGTVNGTMTCSQGGATQTVTLDGTYTPDQYNMRMTSAVAGGPGGGMKMAMSMTSKRVGDCPAQDANN